MIVTKHGFKKKDINTVVQEYLIPLQTFKRELLRAVPLNKLRLPLSM